VTKGGPNLGATVSDAVDVAWIAEAATLSLHRQAPVLIEKVKEQ
jgi:myo-inositol 2-dehydrogenase/D-chiro-inositol 1-dehydrogenase